MKNEFTNYKLDKPRERLYHFGVSSLTDEELLQVIIGSGGKGRSVSKIAKDVLHVLDNKNGSLSFDDLDNIPGVGMAKAGLILSSLEFSRRRIRPEGIKIKQPEDIIPLIQHYSQKKQEHFLTITLNGAHEVIQTRCITIGLLNSSQVHPREVFTDAIQDRAAAIILAHNHPSGNTNPSEADIGVTKILIQSGKILGIKVLDHIIVSPRMNFLSLRNEGVISFD